MVLVFAGQLAASQLPRGFEKLPAPVQAILQNRNTPIHSIQCRISQKIKGPGGLEKRSGYYWATATGKFRADYVEPRESVVYDGKKLYWRIPENGFTWVISTPSAEQKQSPIAQRPRWMSRDFSVEPEGSSWWPFASSEKQSFIVRSPRTRLRVFVNTKWRAIFRRILYDTNGREIMDERMGDPVLFQGVAFFRHVKVSARQRGVLVVSESRYSHNLFNLKLSPRLFAPLPGPYKQYAP